MIAAADVDSSRTVDCAEFCALMALESDEKSQEHQEVLRGLRRRPRERAAAHPASARRSRCRRATMRREG